MTNSETRKMGMPMKKKHFILVHGACHGAWSWFKVKPQLEAAGHKVTAVDLSGAGVDTTKMEEINSFYDYSLPLIDLLESISTDQKVILVGHSFGGFSLALAADKYPDKVSVAVFVAAFMPDSQHSPSYVRDKMKKEYSDAGVEDMRLIPYGSGDEQKMSAVFAPNYLASHLYQLCSLEDLALAKMLVRPIPAQSIMKDLSTTIFSKQGYGSIKKVYIVCNQDKVLRKDFQLWLIENDGCVTKVVEIKDADHMPMICKPQQLSQSLLDIIAENYS